MRSFTWSLIDVADIVLQMWVLPNALLVGLEVDDIHLSTATQKQQALEKDASRQFQGAHTSSKRMSVMKRRMSASVSWLPAM